MWRVVFSRLVVALFFVGVATSCVRVYKKPLLKTHLFITRSPLETRLTWESKVGFLYTVMAKPKRKGALWRPLLGAGNIRGTGGEVSWVDSSRDGVAKRYRLQIVPLAPLKK